MAIILEGPDAAGKTTLGRRLVKDFGMNLIVSGGAPKSRQQVVEYCDMQLKACEDPNNVIDRVTPISHPIYNPVYKGDEMIEHYLNEMVRNLGAIIVFCRPPTEALMRPEKHVWKDYDTEDHKKKILEGQLRFIGLYDEVFRNIPHVNYDYTHADEPDMQRLVKLLGAARYSKAVVAELKELRTCGDPFQSIQR